MLNYNHTQQSVENQQHHDHHHQQQHHLNQQHQLNYPNVSTTTNYNTFGGVTTPTSTVPNSSDFNSNGNFFSKTNISDFSSGITYQQNHLKSSENTKRFSVNNLLQLTSNGLRSDRDLNGENSSGSLLGSLDSRTRGE